MVKIERIDLAGSFETMFKIRDGNTAEEIWVWAWEADNIETLIKATSWANISAILARDGTTTVKEQ